MKKFFLMMALAATALFTVTACGDDSDDNSGSGEGGVVAFNPPPYKDVAKVFNLAGNELGIRQLRMMESESLESYRITPEQKVYLRTLKIRPASGR